jgi:hypothetical protein
VPGGRGMADECTLLGETLDYAVSLRAQVDAMQLLLRTLQATPTTSLNCKSSTCFHFSPTTPVAHVISLFN